MAEGRAERGFGRTARKIVRYMLGVAVGVVVLVLLFGRRGELVAAVHQIQHVDPGWVAAAVLAEALSLGTYTILQHRMLRLSGASIRLPPLYLLSLANDAIANTAPAEPAVSGAYRYRYYRRHGASAASAGWTIFTLLVAQIIGLSPLLIVGVLVALAGGPGPADVRVALLGASIVVVAGTILVRRDLVVRLVGATIRGLRRLTGHPRAPVHQRIEATLGRMREIPLGPRSATGVIGLASGVWLLDFCCLLCSFAAVHTRVPGYGVLLAYGVAQVVAAIPLVPGGIGIVEGSLAVILAAYGGGRVTALSVALVYRLVSFWLCIAVGAIALGVLAWRERQQETQLDALAPAALTASVLRPEPIVRFDPDNV